MKRFLPYASVIAFLICAGFIGDGRDINPEIRKYKLVPCNRRDRMQEGVLHRKFKNHTLRLRLRITGSDHEILNIEQYSGDTLYLSLRHKPKMVIDTIDGRPDTAYLEQGCFCDFYNDIEMTIDHLKSDPKCIRIKTYVIDGKLMKRYDKNGKLGAPRNDSKSRR